MSQSTPAQPQDERDLSFHPVDNPSPQTLTPEQIEHYNDRGFIRGLDIFTDEEAEENRHYFDWLLEQVQQANDGRDSYAINGYHNRCRGLWRITQDPRILDCVEDILGPRFVAWGTHYFCKVPHDPKAVPWHQDASYWPLTPAKTVTVWVAIDDADAGNAAMKIIPGTHRLGHLEWTDTDQQAVLNQEIVNPEQYGEPEYMTLKAGQISMHSDMLVHGSDPNPSDRRRCGLTIRYASMDVRTLNPDWARNSIWARGEDASGHWNNMPEPPGEDPSRRQDQRPIGGN